MMMMALPLARYAVFDQTRFREKVAIMMDFGGFLLDGGKWPWIERSMDSVETVIDTVFQEEIIYIVLSLSRYFR